MKAPFRDMGLVAPTSVHSRNHSHISAHRPDSAAIESVLAGSLTLDNKGSILSCSDAVARLCGVTAEQLTDRPIKSLVAGVPLGPGTEGYNVAFVAFYSSTDRVGSWSLLTANGKSVQVEGTFKLLKLDARYLFRLELRWADDASAAANGRFPLRRPPFAATSSIWAGRNRAKKRARLKLARPDEPASAEKTLSRPRA